MDSLPPDIQDYIRDLRKESEASRKALEAKLKADEEKDQQEKIKQGEWQKVAEQRDLRVKELEPVKERYDALSTLLADQIKAQVKDWPKEVKDLLPSDDTPIEVRYSQVQKLQALAKQLTDQAQAQQRANLPGNTPGPRQVNQEQSRDQQKEEFRLRRVRSGQYGL
jgi:4-alpha-glucanotransferase